MHPDVMRELANQRGHAMRAGAGGNASREDSRGTAQAHAAAAEFVLPRIPDHVDGTSRDTELAGGVRTGGHG